MMGTTPDDDEKHIEVIPSAAKLPAEENNLSFAVEADEAAAAAAVIQSVAAPNLVQPKSQRKYYLKRASDLLPVVFAKNPQTMEVRDGEGLKVVTRLAEQAFTGCIISSRHPQKTRGAMLMHQGRVVGALYSSKTMPDTLPTADSVKLIMRDVKSAGVIKTFELPERIVLPMSALFIGYPVSRTDDDDPLTYLQNIVQWYQNRSQIACISITLPRQCTSCLCFIYRGNYEGAYAVENQELLLAPEQVFDLVREETKAVIDSSVLTPDMLSSAVPYGYEIAKPED